MTVRRSSFVARARTDGRDWLLEAEEPLATLQLRSGGELPGIIATPALLELVRKSRLYGLRLARPIRAQDDHEQVTAWVEISPDPEGEGCVIGVSNWQILPLQDSDGREASQRRNGIARQIAELSARLGPRQDLLSVESQSPELGAVVAKMREGLGRPWTEFVDLEGNSHEQPLHWRLLDGARLRIPGSVRHWKAHLIPLGAPEPGSTGFELYFVAEERDEEAFASVQGPAVEGPAPAFSAAMGGEIAPVLRQPIARIIANAETIRSQLAGPLAEEYSNYAADITSAGEHLLALIDDLTDLEVVEDEQFTTAPDHVDLSDLARRAAGILGMRARERGIRIDAPQKGEKVPAIGEFRRVLQILLNLIGNAIRYSPEGSVVWLRVETEGEIARIVVADQGEGLAEAQQARVFNKFERLGRSGDGGTGLGLYISRKLARAMGGELSVESAPGQGARFVLDLPADTPIAAD
ncbi:HAMP domain-containing histidine kinase [Croceibacterium sp. LX-88]|uniref:histidine kinase n=1 Tax=Croceibacterium selenioxidans TaxID=2838833 RepID=A0ABS5W283_9SPHN|nr:HAMP domain-containing sensor histidine kinase [Croceibacterium selenioxidans]MBT2133851.1 HAMP domain-containing histidine kinase [Croceibacterium selenioxidans]